MRVFGIALIMSSLLTGCGIFTPLPDSVTTPDRVVVFESIPAPEFTKPVSIYWNDFAIPYIIAQDDNDAAYALGLVQAHLRLGQMEIAKRIVNGRISEMIGPFTTDIDWALRTLNIPKAVDDIIDAMPLQSKEWLSSYVRGVNHYKHAVDVGKIDLPHEMKVLDLENEPWTMADSLALGRLGGVDVNWLSMVGLLTEYQSESWSTTFERMKAVQDSHQASFESTKPSALKSSKHHIHQTEKLDILIHALSAFARSGSNSVAVSSSKTKGAPIIANDPHLGFLLPNVWMIAGLKSPSYHVVGMLPIGVPTFAFGRTPHLAWGGTNMRQEASDFVDISMRIDEAITQTYTIANRFWFDRTRESRVHPTYGPVMSDIDIIDFPEGKHIALRWSGYRVSDELTAMLEFTKATNWQEILHAVDEFSVPGQNFIFATKKGLHTPEGDIGHILATHIPTRPIAPPDDIFVSPKVSDIYWQEVLSSTTLPYHINPTSGVIASANNKPYDTNKESHSRVNWYFPSDDRAKRMYALLEAKEHITLEDMKSLQTEVVSPSHTKLKDTFAQLLSTPHSSKESKDIAQRFKNWDGAFAKDSHEALVYHVFFTYFSEELYSQYQVLSGSEVFKRSGLLAKVLLSDIRLTPRTALTKILEHATKSTLEYLDTHDYEVWGDIHRLEVKHLLGNIPLLGGKYKQSNTPIGGYDTTIFKTAGELSLEEHTTRYGSQSRHVSDMSDNNANYFVLYGGQDGHVNSANTYDQVPLWQSGEYIQLPLDAHKVQQDFSYSTHFKATQHSVK